MCVSVIIPVYNAEKYVTEAVESALSQKETKEVIIVEDGSNDDSLNVCKYLSNKYKQVLLRQHPNGANRGAAASRNLGIISAKSRLIAFLDADDWYLPGRFKNAIKLLINDSNVDGVYEAVDVAFENDYARSEWFRRNDFRITCLKGADKAEDVFESIFNKARGYIHLDGLVVRRKCLNKILLFDERLKLGEDTEFCIRLSAGARLFAGSQEFPVATRRMHGKNSIFGELWLRRRSQIIRMWKILFEWSLATDLPDERVNLICDAYLSAAERGAGDNHIYARWRLRIMTLGIVASKFPRAMLSKYYWRHLARAFDLSKAKHLVTGIPIESAELNFSKRNE